jgi:phosphatidylserine/phosphatidylglycerophosphate/cardiolipin synthase-like enzyme
MIKNSKIEMRAFSKALIYSLYLLTFIALDSFAEINIYFNKSVDTTYAFPGNLAQGNVDFIPVILNRVNSAQYSIDMAVYSFDLTTVSYAIINAYNRGVEVRIVYDDRTIQYAIQLLLNAGIPMMQRDNSDGIMHNKFYLFDAREGSSADDDWVLTGSWNATSSGTYTDCQNLLEIQDANLTSAYTLEFNEMFGSSTTTPNPANARFGDEKTDNTPHLFNIDGVEVELYFSPSDGTTSHIIQQIQTANSSACIGMMVFTRYDIANALQQRASAGADIWGIIDDINASGSQWNYLNTFAEMFDWNLTGIFHHKYAFFDYDAPESAPVVVTGSHNWSNAAENDNDENTLILKSADIANLYTQEYSARLASLGGTLPRPIIQAINDLTLEIQEYSLVLTWTSVPGASFYNVYFTVNPHLPYEQWDFLGSTIFPFFVDEDAIYEVKKFYYVTALN